LDRMRQLPLMTRAAAGDAARNDLAALAHEAAEAAHVFVVDEVDLVGAELTDLPPAEPAALDGLLRCRGNGSLLFSWLSRGLERHVVVAGGRVVREGLRGRGDGCRRRRAAPAHELHAFGHDFDDGALAPVLGFPLARLQTTFDKDGTALVEVLAAALRLLAPYDDGEEAGLFALLAALRGVVAIHGQSY